VKKILVCDLDGTLIKTDMLFESVFLLIKSNPLYILILPFWLIKGKQILKNEINKRVEITPNLLPFNQDVIEFIKNRKNSYEKVVLVSASNIEIVKK